MVPPPRATVGSHPILLYIPRPPRVVPGPDTGRHDPPRGELRAVGAEVRLVASAQPMLAIAKAGAVVEAELLDPLRAPVAEVPVKARTPHRRFHVGGSIAGRVQRAPVGLGLVFWR
jgi:hypothetical protein